jgi:hypothetical protein
VCRRQTEATGSKFNVFTILDSFREGPGTGQGDRIYSTDHVG